MKRDFFFPPLLDGSLFITFIFFFIESLVVLGLMIDALFCYFCFPFRFLSCLKVSRRDGGGNREWGKKRRNGGFAYIRFGRRGIFPCCLLLSLSLCLFVCF